MNLPETPPSSGSPAAATYRSLTLRTALTPASLHSMIAASAVASRRPEVFPDPTFLRSNMAATVATNNNVNTNRNNNITSSSNNQSGSAPATAIPFVVPSHTVRRPAPVAPTEVNATPTCVPEAQQSSSPPPAPSSSTTATAATTMSPPTPTTPSSLSPASLLRRRSTRAAAVAARAAFAPATAGTKRRAAEDMVSSPKTKKRRKSSPRKPPPNAKTPQDEEQPLTGKCCICLDDPERQEASRLDGCDHRFCFGCIGKWAERENTCPLCKARFSRIDRIVHLKRKKGVSNTKRVKQRDQRSDILAGTAFEGILQQLLASQPDRVGGTHLGNRFIMSRILPSPDFALRAARDNSEADELRDMMNLFIRGNSARTPYRRIHVATAPWMPPPLSYATNVRDTTAGRAMENPLEIADDDDSDAEVRVVHVTRPASSPPSAAAQPP